MKIYFPEIAHWKVTLSLECVDLRANNSPHIACVLNLSHTKRFQWAIYINDDTNLLIVSMDVSCDMLWSSRDTDADWVRRASPWRDTIGDAGPPELEDPCFRLVDKRLMNEELCLNNFSRSLEKKVNIFGWRCVFVLYQSILRIRYFKFLKSPQRLKTFFKAVSSPTTTH